MIFESERLRFDAWRAEDLPLLYALHADPAVQTGYSVGPEAWTWAGLERRLTSFIDEQRRFGLTKWKLSLRDGPFIGRAGWSPHADGLELGYAVMPAFQGRGFAREAAVASIAWARHHRPSEDLVAFALVGNSASRRVLETAGMRLVDERMVHGALHAFFRHEP